LDSPIKSGNDEGKRLLLVYSLMSSRTWSGTHSESVWSPVYVFSFV